MVSDPISAENFSQIYASLETLDVTQIVSTLMKITPLREEILRRLKPPRRKVSCVSGDFSSCDNKNICLVSKYKTSADGSKVNMT